MEKLIELLILCRRAASAAGADSGERNVKSAGVKYKNVRAALLMPLVDECVAAQQ